MISNCGHDENGDAASDLPGPEEKPETKQVQSGRL